MISVSNSAAEVLFVCRSIVWLQNMHDANLERNRGHPARRLEPQEIRIGRLKHERVKVPRDEKEVSKYVVIFCLLEASWCSMSITFCSYSLNLLSRCTYIRMILYLLMICDD